MAKKHDPNIVIRSIDTLTPYARNARRHSRKQLRKIADSLEKNGQTFPILIDEHGNVLVGHARLEAAKLLGWTSIETRCLIGMTEAEKRAYILADNRLAEEARWDRKLLAVEFNALIEDGFDVEVTGFDTIEIDRVLGFDDAENSEDDQVDLPEPDDIAVSRLGDVWAIEGQRFICGNARDPLAYQRVMRMSGRR